MSYDGIVTRGVVNELKNILIGGRIDKVYQQEKDELLLMVYSKGKNHRLLLSASSNNPRAYITRFSKEKPMSPPMFCMLLRKHLIGGIILDITQYENDRVMVFTISGTDELGEKTKRDLVVEIMGKHSNIILMDHESRKIIDSIKRIPMDVSRVRQILPGLNYSFMELDSKPNPLGITKEVFLNILEGAPGNIQSFKFFYTAFHGLSPLIGREICNNANIDSKRTLISLDTEERSLLYDSFANIMNRAKNNEFKPNYILNKETGEIISFYAFLLSLYGMDNYVLTDTMSQMLDEVYKSKDTYDRVNQKSASLRKILQTKLERAQNKLAKQKEELLESEAREIYKVYGDLLQSNLYRIQKGQDKIVLDNFYDPEMKPIEVPLDIKLSPADNAQKYYKKYAKLKNGYALLSQQIPETQSEISYLEHVLMSMENASDVKELDEIKDELIREGYIQRSGKVKKNAKEIISKPLHFVSSDGFDIFVGRNNRQNEILTMKMARKEDIWFHTKIIPGSHVIVRTNGAVIPEKTMEEAATLAAYYSKGRNSSNIEVDYTEKRNIKKPRNSKPGLVTYDNQKTLVVNPKSEIIKSLKKVED